MGTPLINNIDDFDLQGKTVLLRVDINCPIDGETKRIINETRIRRVAPTIKTLTDRGAKVVILAHQGDILDYHTVISMEEHAAKLSARTGKKIGYIDDVAGPSAIDAIKRLQPGQAILLGNLRYLTEEVSTFENSVSLTSAEMAKTYLVRNLAPLADIYINEAFSLSHRNSPSMIAFEELLPSAGGPLLVDELKVLSKLLEEPRRPMIYLIGGSRIANGIEIMRHILKTGSADIVLTSGLTGIIMEVASGRKLGLDQERFIKSGSLDSLLEPASEILKDHGEKLVQPVDLAYEKNGARIEVPLTSLPIEDALFMDIGEKTIELFENEIARAGTIFVSGTAGAYENPLFEQGTKDLWNSIADSSAFSVISGGDPLGAAQKFVPDYADKFDYICSTSEPVFRFLAGKQLPLIKALEKAYRRGK